MRKEVIAFGFLLCLIFIPFLSAQNESTSTISADAYACLQKKVDEKTCDKLGLEEKIFSLMAINKCEDELVSEAKEYTEGNCWGSSSECSLITTSQGLLALSKTYNDYDSYADWLFAQNKSTGSELEWFIQIEAKNASSCIIYQGDDSGTYDLNAEKKAFEVAPMSCLSVDSNYPYWIKIDPDCYEMEFEITCDEDFFTSLIFKERDSTTINVVDETSSASAGGYTYETVFSRCFGTGASCDLEGTLWATLILGHLGYEISPYLPYITSYATSDSATLPEVFLYYLTNDQEYRTSLMQKQKRNSYWEESGDRFYDTALALMQFEDEDFAEKENSITWLEEQQGADGCWNSGSIKNTAFILYALWPKNFPAPDMNGDDYDCEDAGYFCISSTSCTESLGDEMSSYNCAGLSVCCDKDELVQTCEELDGVVCSSDLSCDGVEDPTAGGLGFGESCCFGECTEKTTTVQENDCEELGSGICREYGCESGEMEDFTYSCAEYSDSCCMPQKNKKSYWWIWLLVILIILAIVAIVFREKLKPYYEKITSKFSKKKQTLPPRRGPPMMPPRRPMPPQMRRPPMMPQRKILPPQPKPSPVKKPTKEKSKELDDVLSKLKEMGK